MHTAIFQTNHFEFLHTTGDKMTTGKITLVGCGGWGKNIARNLHELDALEAVCDPSEFAAQLAEKYGVPHLTDTDAVFADKSVQAVAIAAPARLHFVLAKQAMQTGKDVYVEKPISLDVNEGVQLQSIAQKHARVLMVGHLLHYHPVFLRLKELVKGGKFGRIRQIYSSRLNLGMLRTEENVMWSFAPHDISMILSLMGGAPESVSASATTVLQTGIPDMSTIHLDYGTGPKAEITVSWLHPVKEQQLVVVGDDAMAVFRDTVPWEQKLTLYHNKVEWHGNAPKAIKGEAEIVEVPQGEPLKEEMKHFLECVENRAEPRTGAEEAIPVLSVLQAAQISMDSGGVSVSVNDLYADRDSSKEADRPIDTFVHPTSIVDDGAEIGSGTKIWHYSHVLAGTKMGGKCVVGQNVMVGPEVSVGNGCKIQNNVSIYRGVKLEDDVFCGPSMVFTNVLTPRAHVERKEEFAETVVGKGATIGANATVVCGNQIGKFAMIGAGAVVTKDVPDFALVVGNPARQIGWVSAAGERLGEDLICPRTGDKYHLAASGKLEQAK